jgi:steroid delta-isomerase-like uncharacterized protein
MNAEQIAIETLNAFNAGDRERFAALYADDAVAMEVATGQEARGREAVAALSWVYREAFPDMTGELIASFGCGDRAVGEVTWRGTNTGPLALPSGDTLPPTNRAVENSGCYVFRVRDGKVVERHDYLDMATYLRQLGLMPEG